MIKIESNIPLPSNSDKKPRKRMAKAESPAFSLLNALKFVGITQKKNGPVNVQFAHLSNHWAATSDGILTVAHPIEEDLNACPQTLLLIDALTKVSKELSIVQTNNNVLAITSGGFRAMIPCVNFGDVPIVGPDLASMPVDERLKVALGAVAGIALEGAETLAYNAVLVNRGSTVATNGSALLECWHGLTDVPMMALPRAAALAIAKSALKLTALGYSKSSATFYFENGAFIKTQLFNAQQIGFPPYQHLFTRTIMEMTPVPAELFTAVRKILAYSEDGNIFLDGNNVQSKQNKNEASTYHIEGLPNQIAFSAKMLLSVEHAMKSAHFDTENKYVTFFGDTLPIRGILMAVVIQPITDEDIPF